MLHGVMAVLGLLVAGFLFLDVSIIKMSGPNALEVIERKYVDFARVDADEETRSDYEFLRGWITGNEPHLRDRLGRARAVGIGFALLASVYCFGLGLRLRSRRETLRTDEGRKEPR